MFKSARKRVAVVPAKPTRRGECFSVIGGDVVIAGDVATEENLQVNGRIEGDVRCATLHQGQGGTIVGNLVADEARIAGLVDGTVAARVLVLEPTARVTGDITYEMLSIEGGARVEGRFAHRDGAGESVPARHPGETLAALFPAEAEEQDPV